VFVGPALLSSLLAIAFKVRLLTQRVTQKRALAAKSAKKASTRCARKRLLHALAARFMLQHDKFEYEDAKRANDRERYTAYGYMLGVLTEAIAPSHSTLSLCISPVRTPLSQNLSAANDNLAQRVRSLGESATLCAQDVPFAIVNAVFLVRTVNDKRSDVTIMLCVLLTSIASLVYKVMKLRTIPKVWQEHRRLLDVKAELAERAMRLQESEGQCQQDSSGESDGDEDEGKAARAPERKSSADPAMCSGQTHASASVRAQQKMVVEVTTFEIGVFPECGR
jgi:hypothetical protein